LRLETRTDSYLQDWITAQAAAAKSSQTGANPRLRAAQELQDKLKFILAGEPPYDISSAGSPSPSSPSAGTPTSTTVSASTSARS